MEGGTYGSANVPNSFTDVPTGVAGQIKPVEPLATLLRRTRESSDQGQSLTALLLMVEAARYLPDDPGFLVRHGTKILAKCRDAEAEAFLNSFHSLTGDPVQLGRIRAYTMRRLSRPEKADAVLAELCSSRSGSDMVGVWLQRLDMVNAPADLDRALELSAEALDRIGPDPRLLERRSRLLQRAGQTKAALACYKAIPADKPQYPEAKKKIAELLLALGRRDEAWQACAEVLALSPQDSKTAILQGRLAESTAEITTARATFRYCIDTMADRNLAPTEQAELVLWASRLALRSGAQAEAVSILDMRPLELDEVRDMVVDDLAQLAVALNHGAVVRATIGSLLRRDQLAPQITCRLAGLSRAVLDASQFRSLVDTLVSRVASDLRGWTEVEIALDVDGPAVALERARRSGRRTRRDAAQLVRILMALGQTMLALRYGRLCLRLWPGAHEIGGPLVYAAVREGNLRFADELVNTLQGPADVKPTHLIRRHRAHVLTHAGQLEEALDSLACIPEAEAPRDALEQRLRLLIELGRLDEAEALAVVVRRREAEQASGSVHFSQSFVGALLNEQRLLRQAEQGLPSGMPLRQRRAHLARDFYLPAVQVIHDWIASKGQANVTGPIFAGASGIPQRIMQYWDAPTPPEDIAAACESWSTLPGFDYIRFSRHTASAWLGKRFNRNFVRAFQSANKPAQEADFLRLCWLYSEGGVYADADDRLAGSLDEILNWARGALLFHEPWGAIANNFIAVRPRHPVIRRATQEALRSLLARENDSTWTKTGPGLLTRATALTMLEEDPEMLSLDLTILPMHLLQCEVKMYLPTAHKRTARHWNQQERAATPAMVRDAFLQATS